MQPHNNKNGILPYDATYSEPSFCSASANRVRFARPSHGLETFLANARRSVTHLGVEGHSSINNKERWSQTDASGQTVAPRLSLSPLSLALSATHCRDTNPISSLPFADLSSNVGVNFAVSSTHGAA